MGFFLIMLGFAINAVCSIVVVVQAFKVSVGWGLAVLFLPFAGLVFIFRNWEQTKAPFLGGLGGVALMVFGFLGIAASTPEPRATTTESQPASPSRESSEPRTTYASAAAPPSVPYDPPRSAYTPSYTPSYVPPPQPPQEPPPAADDDWRPKPVYEQVYVDRRTNQFYAEKCKKRPENAYRIPRSVAVMQGITEAKCR